MSQTVLVTGGAGYKGSVLVPKLLATGYRVRVLDLFLYGREALHEVGNHAGLELLEGDLRDPRMVRRALQGADHVVHLACISNDPSAELSKELTWSVNFDAFRQLLALAEEARVRRLVFASSSSVYGVSDAPEVREDHPRVPVSEYNRTKASCEDHLFARQREGLRLDAVTVRPATVCGPSPRLRLDLTVNLLTSHAFHRRRITVFGGAQYRPNVHIEDITDLYAQLLEGPMGDKAAGHVYNAGYENLTVAAIARRVKATVEREAGLTGLPIDTTPTDDIRSYRVNSDKLTRELGWRPRRSIDDAARSLVQAFLADRHPDAMESDRYHNVRRMKALQLK